MGVGLGGKQAMYLERCPWCVTAHIPPVAPPSDHQALALVSSPNEGAKSSFCRSGECVRGLEGLWGVCRGEPIPTVLAGLSRDRMDLLTAQCGAVGKDQGADLRGKVGSPQGRGEFPS